jgi:hypothetical protein
MHFDTVNAALITVAFLVPGFVWSSVLSMTIPRRSRAAELRTLEFLTLSSLNHGLWSWLWIIGFRSHLVEGHPYWTALLCFVVLFLSPLALGLVTGLILAGKTPVVGLLSRLGYQPLKAIPTAWDYLFAKREPYWVVVILKDGARIYGLYGLKSFAGDEPGQRDLYLEATYRPTDKGDWAPVEDTGGVLITAEQIAVLEFRRLTEFAYDQKIDESE